jgi:hypothetical protein
MALVVDPKRRNAPAPNDRTRAKTRDCPFKFTIDQTFDAFARCPRRAAQQRSDCVRGDS